LPPKQLTTELWALECWSSAKGAALPLISHLRNRQIINRAVRPYHDQVE
jgi:hypothetical protein